MGSVAAPMKDLVAESGPAQPKPGGPLTQEVPRVTPAVPALR